jgi:TPR repeat protein
MTGILKKKNCIGTALLAASVLSMLHGDLHAAERKAVDACPSHDFAQFLTAFAANTETQQRFTAPSVKLLKLKPAAQPTRFEPITTAVKSSRLAFPLILPIRTNSEAIATSVIDDSHVNVIDKRAGNSNIKVLTFARESCWVLKEVEDWSIHEKDLSASNKPSMSSVESNCFQRGVAYAGLGGLEQHPLTNELFEASLENYMCAAASGDPDASLAAASLSLSGMAPQLEISKVEALYNAAATTLAEGAAGLSSFYCYGNDPTAEGPCQHPVQAEEALIRAVAMGSIDATNYLGYSFETGELATKDMARALACYRLAADKGNEAAANNFNRLETQTAAATKASYCY